MSDPEPTIRVKVDPTNPGQFFACCGLLELADRLWPGAEGWFADGEFRIAAEGRALPELIAAIVSAELKLIDENDIYSGRVEVGKPFRPLVLDWWHAAGGKKDAKDLKVWAGTMESFGIARAMQHAARPSQSDPTDMLNYGCVAYNPEGDKKEPYYFDARRGPNAHSRDVGFSANDLGVTTTAFPAVEFLCLVGLQRCLPARTEEVRVYDYFTWAAPLAPALVPAAVSGFLPAVGSQGYRFENWFRTGQRKHKAFRSAIPLSKGSAQ